MRMRPFAGRIPRKTKKRLLRELGRPGRFRRAGRDWWIETAQMTYQAHRSDTFHLVPDEEGFRRFMASAFAPVTELFELLGMFGSPVVAP
jgi:hypothetical protein